MAEAGGEFRADATLQAGKVGGIDAVVVGQVAAAANDNAKGVALLQRKQPLRHQIEISRSAGGNDDVGTALPGDPKGVTA